MSDGVHQSERPRGDHPKVGGMWDTLYRLWALVQKEMRMIMKDPRSRFAVIIPPLVQLVVFGYAATFDVSQVPMAVLDESRTEASKELVAAFEATDTFRRVATVQDVRQLRERISSQQARVGLHIGATFARDLRAGRPAPVQLIVDGRNSNSSAVAMGYATRIVSAFNASLPSVAPITQPSPPRGNRVVLIDRAWFNPNYLSRWFFVPAIVVQLVLIEVLLVCSLSVAREREQGTFDQLLVSPYAAWEVLAGKAAPGIIVGLPQAGMAVLVGVFWFGVPLRGSVLALFVGLLVYIACAAGVGLFISSLARTMQQALLGTFLFVMPAVLLSGLTTPVEDMPQWIQHLTVVNPLKYALHIGRDVFLRGTALGDMTGDLLPLGIIAIVSLVVAGVMFRLRSQ